MTNPNNLSHLGLLTKPTGRTVTQENKQDKQSLCQRYLPSNDSTSRDDQGWRSPSQHYPQRGNSWWYKHSGHLREQRPQRARGRAGELRGRSGVRDRLGQAKDQEASDRQGAQGPRPQESSGGGALTVKSGN